MFLALDVGNSNTVIGIYEEGGLAHDWRVQTITGTTADEYSVMLRELLQAEGLSFRDIDECGVSSVVPTVERELLKFGDRYLATRPKIVGKELQPEIDIQVANPEEVGADRLVNAEAAYAEYRRNTIIVDFGTATTFDAVSGRGAYVGGVIAPGATVASEALFAKASKLPKVEMTKPDEVVGRTTVGAMKSGLYYGYRGLITEIVTQMQDSFEEDPLVVATGGEADIFAGELELLDEVDPYLTLDGLSILLERLVGTS